MGSFDHTYSFLPYLSSVSLQVYFTNLNTMPFKIQTNFTRFTQQKVLKIILKTEQQLQLKKIFNLLL